MVILKKTGKFIDSKGNRLSIDSEQVVERESIGEVWLSSGGSFEPEPMTLLGTKEAHKLISADRQELLDEGYRLWKFDALGGTIVSLTTYFVLGRGINFLFDDEGVQKFAKKFYKKNKLEMRLRSASDESVALGEVFIWLRPKFDEVRRGRKILWRKGDTQVTFIRPDNITSIETADEDPTDVFNYIHEYLDAERNPISNQIPDITKYDAEGANKETGCIVHIKLNSGNMDVFGHSDLIRIKEWLDNYQEYLRDGVIINKLYRSPCFDISIEDATIPEINAAISRYRNWTIGSNPVHASTETWQILEFTGPNTSSENSRRALLLIIAAGVGFAEYMLADGANANLASSKSQQLPVIKKFEDRQDIFAHFMWEVFQFALMIKAINVPNSMLQSSFDEEGDFEEFSGKIGFPAIAQETDVDIAQTNEAALARGYMAPRTAAARLDLDYARETETMLSDADIVSKLREKDINTIIGTPEPPEPVATTNGNPTSPGSSSSRSN